MVASVNFRVHNIHFDIDLTQSLFQDHMMAALTPSVTSAFNKKKKGRRRKAIAAMSFLVETWFT